MGKWVTLGHKYTFVKMEIHGESGKCWDMCIRHFGFAHILLPPGGYSYPNMPHFPNVSPLYFVNRWLSQTNLGFSQYGSYISSSTSSTSFYISTSISSSTSSTSFYISTSISSSTSSTSFYISRLLLLYLLLLMYLLFLKCTYLYLLLLVSTFSKMYLFVPTFTCTYFF